MSNAAQIKAILNGLQRVDPRLYTLLSLITDDIQQINEDLFPTITSTVNNILNSIAAPVKPTFTTTDVIHPTNIRLKWQANDTLSRTFEVREEIIDQNNPNWDTAEFRVRTSNLEAVFDPITAVPHMYLLKAINTNGVYSEDFDRLTVTPSAPAGINTTINVIDNNVLLYWTAPTIGASNFDIDYFIVKRNGVNFGTTRSTFTTIFESVGGDYEYAIVAVDLAGNNGAIFTRLVHVNAPPDFELLATFDSTFTGTKTRCIALPNGHLLAPVNNTELFQEHFINHGWSTPQNQIDAGYPIYIQPSAADAKYVEVVDYGAIFSNIIVHVVYETLIIVGTVAITVTLEASDDNITYSFPQTGTNAFFNSARYIRVTLDFVPADDLSLIEVTKLQLLLDVKREVDSGELDASKDDVDGTVVTFNKTFKDVDSITLTTQSITPIIAIYDFVDIPNPTTFKVLLYDSTGNRVSDHVSWKARGIV